jgi:hypothetical protein
MHDFTVRAILKGLLAAAIKGKVPPLLIAKVLVEREQLIAMIRQQLKPGPATEHSCPTCEP